MKVKKFQEKWDFFTDYISESFLVSIRCRVMGFMEKYSIKNKIYRRL